ncbi:MAG: hypothetical protein Q8882_07760, partial [Bacillota bacterium]|nr:hypothetical protein [Bacillota bacterium]
MSLKASFFNKSIIKSDFKRFWWISVLNALTVFFFGLFPFLNSSNNYVTTGKFSESSFASSAATLTYMWDGIFALLTVALLFIYLNHSGSVAVMHGLPLKRKNLYFSHMLSGACLLVAPLILNFGILFLFRLSDSIAKVLPVKYILIWAYIYFVYMIVVFSFTSLVAMITGSTIANIIFTAIFGLVPVAIEYFLATFIKEQIYGCMPEWNYFTTRWVYLNYDALLTYKALIYLVLVILFVYFAVVLYNKRPLEANGEVVAFKVLRPLFIYGVALGSGMLGYLYFSKIIS